MALRYMNYSLQAAHSSQIPMALPDEPNMPSYIFLFSFSYQLLSMAGGRARGRFPLNRPLSQMTPAGRVLSFSFLQSRACPDQDIHSTSCLLHSTPPCQGVPPRCRAWVWRMLA